METIVASLVDPEGQGILVPASASSTQETLAAYTSFPPARLSWTRGFSKGRLWIWTSICRQRCSSLRLASNSELFGVPLEPRVLPDSPNGS
jgi:hypothetical protein